MATEAPAREDLTAIIADIQQRVRARYPQGKLIGLGVELPDLAALLHARDIAYAKVAAIGTVNPRRAGVVNDAIQLVKRTIARSLRWFVRDQVEFNRAVLECVQTTMDALQQSNRVLAALHASYQGDEGTLADLRSSWLDWRDEWNRRLDQMEIKALQDIAELQSAYQYRVTTAEVNFRELLRAHEEQLALLRAAWERQLSELVRATGEQTKATNLMLETRDRASHADALRMHQEFTTALAQASTALEQQMWQHLTQTRVEFERLIHTELRVMRQRTANAPAGAAAPVPSTASEPPVLFDYGRFAERFRGSEAYVRAGQQQYREVFAGCQRVLDLGCGRGEFLELMGEAGVPATGVETSLECVRLVESKGLAVVQDDLFDYLGNLPEGSVDGIFCAQVVEHLPPLRVFDLVRLASSRLKTAGRLVIETPNPECLAIFASHFYLDPTHKRPIPPPLLAFYCEECGLGQIEVLRRSPAVESLPSLAELAPAFREAFFGALDYAVVARKL